MHSKVATTISRVIHNANNSSLTLFPLTCIHYWNSQSIILFILKWKSPILQWIWFYNSAKKHNAARVCACKVKLPILHIVISFKQKSLEEHGEHLNDFLSWTCTILYTCDLIIYFLKYVTLFYYIVAQWPVKVIESLRNCIYWVLELIYFEQE